MDNFKACYNGLEKVINCKLWPQSDIEMISNTINDYINDYICIDKEKYNVQYGRIFINKRIEELNTRKEDFVTFRYYRKKQQEYGKSIQMPYDDALTLSHWRMDDGRYKNFLFVIDSNE